MPASTLQKNQLELLSYAKIAYARLVTGNGDPRKLVPEIRGYLNAAGLDESTLSVSGKSAKTIAEKLESYLSKANKKGQKNARSDYSKMVAPKIPPKAN